MRITLNIMHIYLCNAMIEHDFLGRIQGGAACVRDLGRPIIGEDAP